MTFLTIFQEGKGAYRYYSTGTLHFTTGISLGFVTKSLYRIGYKNVITVLLLN